MEIRKLEITLQKAREWYNSGDNALKNIALQVFDKDKLECSFKEITSLKEACKALNIEYYVVNNLASHIAKISKASAAMFKVNIIRKALNLGQDLHLVKNIEDALIYHPYNPFVTEASTHYKSDIKNGEMEVIGKIRSEGTIYNVLGGRSYSSGSYDLGCFNPDNGVGHSSAFLGFLGCASMEIAQYFGKHFGMLITEAKYGDMVDFEIVSGY